MNRQYFDARDRSQGYNRAPPLQRGNPPRRTFQPPQPYPQNPQLATSLYYFTLNRLEKYLERFFTRYYDFFKDEGRSEEAEAISPNAVQQLAAQLETQHGREQAAVMIMCDNYSRIALPQAATASDKLKSWAEYLYAHLDPAVVPSPFQQRYEQNMMEQAHTTADELWTTFRVFSKDPVAWGNAWARQEALRVYEELEKAGDAAYRLWLQENQPDRVPQPKPILKLRPEADSFIFIPRPTESSTAPPVATSEAPTTQKSKVVIRALTSPHKLETQDSGYDSSRDSSSSDRQERSDKKKHKKVLTPPASPTSSDMEVSPPGSLRSRKPKAQQSNSTRSTPSNIADEMIEKATTSTDEAVTQVPATSSAPMPETRARGDSIINKHQFNKTIMMFSRFVSDIPVTAKFDTGAEGGNWVSKELIRQLKLEQDIWSCPSPQPPTVSFLDAGGRSIQANSYIELSWKWHSEDKHKYRYSKFHTCKFWILPRIIYRFCLGQIILGRIILCILMMMRRWRR
ncbi:hypothetical protein B0J14DRAFT_156751 [Halenospora varia]|nr:hypothetical protein B0J14DRAFT_156751 [Halenospora varia]